MIEIINVCTFDWYDVLMSQPRICTVASHKGGVGKSTLAYEIAQLTGSVLVDFEWDGGGVSTTWGYNPDARTSDPLMHALERDRTPRVLSGKGTKPDLVPGSPFLQDSGLEAEDFGARLVAWAREWDRNVVIDTHPGANPPANGAMSESHVIVVPTPLRTKDLAGTERMVRAMLDYPLLVVPNVVPPIPPKIPIQRLTTIVEGTNVRVGPIISDGGRWIHGRNRRMAISADTPPSKRLAPIVEQLRALARTVEEYGND